MRILLISVLAFSVFSLNAQRGKDGNLTVSGSSTIVNTYTFLTQGVTQGSNTISVASTTGLSTGDLILIIQMQGALIRNKSFFGSFSSFFGEVINYNNCGLYEFQQINSINANQIIFDCGLKNSYDTNFFANTQIVRVPRFNQLSIVPGGVLTCPAWNGKTGGIVAVETLQNTLLNGQINANGKGFRGGEKNNLSVAPSVKIFEVASTDSSYGGEKGESIGGYKGWYAGFGGPYGRGAPANGGGGGNGHNSGGGGGANAGIGSWNGLGNADPGPNNIYVPIWNLDSVPFSNFVSTGGGRGGYSFSMYEQDATIIPPGAPLWGGNDRANNGGLGGRPLNNGINSERVFFGGGGGAGDGNDGCAGSGGQGGGIVFIISHADITGSGFIRTNGLDGETTLSPGNDAPGGAGGGGSIILNAQGSVSGINTFANGGNGGSQFISSPEAEGPGGGGGGGYIAHSGGSFNQEAKGGNNGITNSPSLNEFPPNGATKGGNGLTNQNVTNFSITANDVFICPGNSAQLFASLTGNVPNGTNINWYYNSSGGTPFHTGSSWTTPLLNSTTTYYVGSCPGTYRIPVNVYIHQPPAIDAGNDTTICLGDSIQLNATQGFATYLWGPNSQLINPLTPNPKGAPLVTTTYTVNVSDVNGCTNTDIVIVTVNQLPQVTAGASQLSVCEGSPTTVFASGGVSYIWNNGQTAQSFSASPILPSIFEVTVTDAFGCSNSSSVTISTLPLPIANAGIDTSVCFGSGVTLNASGGISYAWQPTNTLSNSNIHNPVATPSNTTTYTVTVSNIHGCTTQDNVVVNVHPLPIVSAGNNQSICLGDSTTLTANGGVFYHWNTGENTPSITVSPLVNTVYTVTATDAFGCTNTDNVVVNVLPLPIAYAGNDTSICPGTSAQLYASGGTTYSWSPGTGLNNVNIFNPIANPLSEITYTVNVTDTNGCSQTDDVVISIYPEPNVFIEADIYSGCPPLTVTFNDTASNIATWQWNFGDPASDTNNVSNLQFPTHVYNNSGNYTPSLTLTSVHGCSKTGVFNNLITVYPNPIASFDVDPSELSVFHPTFSFINNSFDAVAWLWNFGGIIQATSTDFEPTYTYNEEGTYTVSLIVESIHGCTDTTSSDVIVKPEFTFFIPNVFTPDEDGLNDYFKPVGRNFSDFKMLIYDRWGALIYETNDYNKPWNGKVQNSSEFCMADVYVYIITVKDFKNRPRKYTGHVTLMK